MLEDMNCQELYIYESLEGVTCQMKTSENVNCQTRTAR